LSLLPGREEHLSQPPLEGQLAPAFASIETSVQSIVGSLGAGWEKLKGLGAEALDFLSEMKAKLPAIFDEWALKLEPVKAIFQWIWDIIQKIYEKIKEALVVYEQVTAIAEMAMPGGAAGAPMLAGEEASVFEQVLDQGVVETALQKMAEWSPINWLTGGAWSDWWDQNVVGPLTGRIADSESEITTAVEQGVEEPVMSTFERLSEDLVGFSVVPDMVRDVVDWFERMTLDLTPWLDQLTSKFNILSTAIQGIPPIQKDLLQFDSGQLKIVTVNLQGSTFGAGLSEWEIKDWMFEAIGDMV